jgi:hypothetical protein
VSCSLRAACAVSGDRLGDGGVFLSHNPKHLNGICFRSFDGCLGPRIGSAAGRLEGGVPGGEDGPKFFVGASDYRCLATVAQAGAVPC